MKNETKLLISTVSLLISLIVSSFTWAYIVREQKKEIEFLERYSLAQHKALKKSINIMVELQHYDQEFYDLVEEVGDVE